MKTLKNHTLLYYHSYNYENTIQQYKNNSMSLFYEYSSHLWHESRRFFFRSSQRILAKTILKFKKLQLHTIHT